MFFAFNSTKECVSPWHALVEPSCSNIDDEACDMWPASLSINRSRTYYCSERGTECCYSVSSLEIYINSSISCSCWAECIAIPNMKYFVSSVVEGSSKRDANQDIFKPFIFIYKILVMAFIRQCGKRVTSVSTLKKGFDKKCILVYPKKMF